MDLLPVNFFILRFCGVWKDREDTNLIINLFIFCYRYTIAIVIYLFTISEIILLLRTRNNIEDLIEVLFLTLTYMTLCLKYINFSVRQCELRTLLDCFRIELCQPRDSTEKSILRKYSRKAKQNACLYLFICQTTGLLFLAVPLLTPGKRRLPCKVYLPYSIATLVPYVLTYLQQVVAFTYGIIINVSFDSLVYGLIIHTCGQIELLCHRLTETFKFFRDIDEERKTDAAENSAIAECVIHHILIYNIIQRIQSLFVWTVVILFFFSLITLCTSIYQISKKEFFSFEFFNIMLYLGSMMFQVFSYCWYGNELDLKNKSIAHAVYTSNWTVISAKQRKNLLLVMMMSQRGRILSFYGVCSLILNTFTWIIRTSYSAFNLLQQISN